MVMARRAVRLVLLLVLLVVAAPQAAIADGLRLLPFRATSTLVSATELMPMPQCGGQGFLGETDIYSGTGTHLGTFTLTETLCMDFRTFNPPAQPLIPYEVTGTYVAANDDVLSYFATGAFNVVTGANTGKGFSFTGGTGRFTSAQGSGSTAFVFDENGEIVGLRQTGMISYEASDRSG